MTSFWVMGSEFWVMGSELWAMGSELWAMGSEFWAGSVTAMTFEDESPPKTQHPRPLMSICRIDINP